MRNVTTTRNYTIIFQNIKRKSIGGTGFYTVLQLTLRPVSPCSSIRFSTSVRHNYPSALRTRNTCGPHLCSDSVLSLSPSSPWHSPPHRHHTSSQTSVFSVITPSARDHLHHTRSRGGQLELIARTNSHHQSRTFSSSLPLSTKMLIMSPITPLKTCGGICEVTFSASCLKIQ